MKRIMLNNTDLSVSPLCMGTVHYGTAVNSEDAKEQLSRFIELGGNFIDTAHIYGDWVRGLRGRSERVIGEWIKETRRRSDIIISTKGAHPDILLDPSIPRVNPEAIENDLDESLDFLNTDYIDLYFLHRDDPSVPVEEILDTLEKARSEGKIRYYGCSNWTLPRIIEASNYAREQNIPGFVCNQLMWSLADINSRGVTDKTLVIMDEEIYDYHKKTGMNAMAYTSAARGYFSKLKQGGQIAQDIQAAYDTASNMQIFEELVNTADELNADIIQVEIAFLMNQEFPSIPLVSFSSIGQLEQGMGSCQLELDEDTVNRLCNLKEYVIE
ncbi:MAG: aldo/keto reductase [Clostridiales bacterium]|nr:aldo/keto reductase [Clostridiales bacterium]